MEKKVVNSTEVFISVGACPYCGSDVRATGDTWEKNEDGTWNVIQIDAECTSIPDPSQGQDWREWMAEHSEMPYEHWHPMVTRFLKDIQKQYIFNL